MSRVDEIQNDPIPTGVARPLALVVQSLGGSGFYRAVGAALRDELPIDRLYLFDGTARTEPLIAETESDKPVVTGSTYARQFLPLDPLQGVIDALQDAGCVTRLRVTPLDIVVPSYRAMLERAGVVERVSFVRRQGKGWRCMTVVRRGPHGPFDADELQLLGGFFLLVVPLIDRHRELTGEVVENRASRIAELEERFAARFPELTPREVQVCARAAIGISIEGAALDLGVGTASVLTYRKRAYRRLAITSANELAQLVMR